MGLFTHHQFVTDEQLARSVVDGNPEAIDQFVACHYAPVMRFLWNSGASYEDAQDLASQTMLKSREALRGFRGQGTLRSWVFRVGQRELLMLRRRQKLRSLFESQSHPEAVSPDLDSAIELQQALDQLPSHHRSAFLLTEVEGLTTEEAARVLEVPAGTVKSRCHHARMRLRVILSPAVEEVKPCPEM